jgi:uncharacterized protein (TIGR02145 family)
MKIVFKSILLSFLLITSGLSAQPPQSFKYKAVVRDPSGVIITNQLISARVSILKGSETGIADYSEIHAVTTNPFGTITFDIGKGVVESGSFTNIDWGNNNYFIKLEIDIAGGTNFVFMGTSQLLSVPYSMHTVTSEKLMTLTTEQRDTMNTIPIGTNFFNTTTKKINYYDGIHWFEVNGTCLPQPTQPDAGPDQNNIAAATTIIQANTPSSGTGVWIIKSGIGGYIGDPDNPSTVFSGLPGNTYTLSWVISNSCGSLSDDVLINLASFICGSTFKDIRDNQVYSSVLIGSQCWMAKNLNIGTRIGGDEIMTNNSIIEKYCHGNIDTNCDVYGGLYQWNEMMQYSTTPGIQGICMTGWHLPTDSEWKTLEGTIDSQYPVGDPVWDLEGDRGYDAGGKLKETGTLHWAFPNTGATNSSGFTALPGGARNTDGTFPSFLVSGRFWTSTESGSNAYRHILSTLLMDIARNAATKNFGLSVRCIKN